MPLETTKVELIWVEKLTAAGFRDEKNKNHPQNFV